MITIVTGVSIQKKKHHAKMDEKRGWSGYQNGKTGRDSHGAED